MHAGLVHVATIAGVSSNHLRLWYGIMVSNMVVVSVSRRSDLHADGRRI